MVLKDLIVCLLLFTTYITALPFHYIITRDDKIQLNDSSTIKSISTKLPYKDPNDISDDLSKKTDSLFFHDDTYTWSDICNGTKAPVVWPVAVAGKVLADTEDEDLINKALSSLKAYRASSGGYSASMGGNPQIYTDDNAQISWVFSSAYSTTNDNSTLSENKNLTGFLQENKDKQRGGIKWLVTSDYIALISNLETAVAAMKLNSISGDDEFVPLAKYCIVWTLQNLLDNSDTNDDFIYDGMYEDGSLNKGKLTYTIGTLISACAYLTKIGDTEQNWQQIAVTMGIRFISAGELNNQFFTDGHINDIIERSHLVFVGFADLLELTTPQDDHQQKAYKSFKQLITRESRYLYDQYSDTINSDSCPSNEFNDLLKYSSLAQVFHAVSRVVDLI